MRGTVLLLDRSSAVGVDLLRASGLVVHACVNADDALEQLRREPLDVAVVVLSAHDSPASISALRETADQATSIIVMSVPESRETARTMGADSFLVNSTETGDLLYEIQRALILRRSGRRLPWHR